MTRLHETLLRRFARSHPSEAATLLGAQSAEEAAAVLRQLPEEEAADLLERTAAPVATAALAQLDPTLASALLARFALDRSVSLLRSLAPATREALLAALPRSERLRSLVAYPRGTAGALMDPSVLALPADLDCTEARRRLGRFATHLALDLYLVDADHRLIGVADLRELLDPERHGTLAGLARTLEPLREYADLEAVGAHPGWLHHDTLPVVDDRGAYLGAVRGERLRRFAHEAIARRTRGGADAVVALGELFWLGLSGLFSSLARPRNEEAT